MRLLFISVLLFCFSFAGKTQNDSCNLRISVLTCAPGEELYSTFGHTAVRIIDSSTAMDVVFNYGTFDFNDPDFYTKFVRGKLEYFLSYDGLQNFLYSYRLENRSVIEQELNLSCEEKQQFFLAIQNNLKAENKFYKYDFLYDNCTSRVRDLLKKYVSGFQIKKALIPEGTSSRDLLYEYLDKGGKPWSKLGIDILLGSKLDEPIDNNHAMFLPDYLMHGIDSAQSANGTLVKSKEYIFHSEVKTEAGNKHTATIVFAIIALLIVLFSQFGEGKYPIVMKVIDSLLFYIAGLIGLLLLFMWLGTDHSVCAKNYNLLWALPTHFFAAFFIIKPNSFSKKYFRVTSVLHFLFLAAWFWLPQQFNEALIPIVFLLAYRSFKLSSK